MYPSSTFPAPPPDSLEVSAEKSLHLTDLFRQQRGLEALGQVGGVHDLRRQTAHAEGGNTYMYKGNTNSE